MGGAVGFRDGVLTLLAGRNTLLETLGQWFRPENAVESCGRDQKKLGMPWRRSGLAVAGLQNQKACRILGSSHDAVQVRRQLLPGLVTDGDGLAVAESLTDRSLVWSGRPEGTGRLEKCHAGPRRTAWRKQPGEAIVS